MAIEERVDGNHCLVQHPVSHTVYGAKIRANLNYKAISQLCPELSNSLPEMEE